MKTRIIIILISLITISSGCKKFLDETPNKNLVIPSNINDLQALLDDYDVINLSPSVGELSTNDYYLTDADWSALSQESNRRIYLWEKDYIYSLPCTDWQFSYRIVYYANSALDNLSKISRIESNQQDWDNIRGQALFLRAKSYLENAAIWCNAYQKTSSKEDLGVPLRQNSDFNISSVRSTLDETYNQIINDLKEASTLLPINPIHVSRPSKTAAFALLARTYLFMRDYENCFYYANECLKLKNTLIDYNVLTPSATYPIKEFNDEVIYTSRISIPAPLNNTRAKIDPTLYSSYQTGDLRKVIYFKNNNNGSYGFKGSYQGTVTPFSGLATDEIWLMRAECYIRNGNLESGLDDLNTLLKKRWDKNLQFPAYSTTNRDEAISKVILERRKELLFRCLRFMDIKRLNIEGANISLARIINGMTYTLPAKDLRFALPIPEDVIEKSKIKQNPR